MLIPISWLKDYVEIKLPLKELMWKLTEAGLTCESYKKVGNDTVLDIEVTANRPDWMSVVGVAREIAAIENVKLKEPKIKELPKKSKSLPMDLKNDFEILSRWSALTIAGITVKPSPKWMQERLKLIGLRPINNIVDITNYVMFELGIPMHAFDYDEIRGQIMIVKKSKGGEDFTSVDELSYRLPKNAMIIRDSERIIDLCGIKGGYNSGIKSNTKNLFIHCTIDNPVLTRRASIAMGLRSDASAIYERGPDKGGSIRTLKRMTNLILDLAGGEIASDIYDLKKERFEPWKITLIYQKLEKVLGIKIDIKKVIAILSKLNLNPKKSKDGIICTVPTYRADIKLEEDLIEEVARIYGYNKFPKTLPRSSVVAKKIPYYFNDKLISKTKDLMVASGYSEAMTLSLVSKENLKIFGIDINKLTKLTNPVSLEYEYLRGSLAPSLVLGLKVNQQTIVKLFEIDKVFPGEEYKLSTMTKGISFREFKGLIDLMLDRFNIKNVKIDFETNCPYLHPSVSGSIRVGNETLGEFGEINPQVAAKLDIKEKVYVLEMDMGYLDKNLKLETYRTPPETPAQVEDLTLVFPAKTRMGEVINLLPEGELVGRYKGSYTFRVKYQGTNKTLTNIEVEKVRNKILKEIKNKFGGRLKD